MRWLLLLTPLLLAPSAAADCPTRLRIGFSEKDLPPYLNGRGPEFAQPPGLAVDWVRQALAELGCRDPQLRRAPVRRLTTDLIAGQLQLLIGFAYTPERAPLMRFPQRADGSPDPRLALTDARISLYVLASRRDSMRWDGQMLAPPTLRVGYVSGALEEPTALGRAWLLEPAPNAVANLSKLRIGRIDALLSSDLSYAAAELQQAPEVVELDPPVQRSAFYAPANLAFHARHEALVQAFWLKLCRAARKTNAERMPACG